MPRRVTARLYLSDSDMACAVLGLEAEPVIPFLDMGGWRCPPAAWIEWSALQHLVSYPAGARVSEVAEVSGVRGATVSGRLRALVNRGVLVEVRGRALQELEETLYDHPATGKAYRLSAKSWRRVEAAAKRTRRAA